jgi:hypothetical protein
MWRTMCNHGKHRCLHVPMVEQGVQSVKDDESIAFGDHLSPMSSRERRLRRPRIALSNELAKSSGRPPAAAILGQPPKAGTPIY